MATKFLPMLLIKLKVKKGKQFVQYVTLKGENKIEGKENLFTSELGCIKVNAVGISSPQSFEFLSPC